MQVYQGNGIVVAHISLDFNIFILIKLRYAYILLCIFDTLPGLLFLEFLLLNSLWCHTGCITIFMYVDRLTKSLDIDIPFFFVNECT